MARKPLGKPREVEVSAEDVLPPVLPEVVPEAPDTGLFDDLSTIPPSPRPVDSIPPLDIDLTPDEKAEFKKLLSAEMSLKERAHCLAELARMKDQKRAAVGLRAIIEINAITGVSGGSPTEATPIFALPPDTSVSVQITKVVK